MNLQTAIFLGKFRIFIILFYLSGRNFGGNFLLQMSFCFVWSSTKSNSNQSFFIDYTLYIMLLLNRTRYKAVPLQLGFYLTRVEYSRTRFLPPWIFVQGYFYLVFKCDFYRHSTGSKNTKFKKKMFLVTFVRINGYWRISSMN